MNDTENEEKSYSVHASFSFVLPPRSETIIAGKLDEALQPNTTGMITAREDLPERYLTIGAAELVKLSEEHTVPIRLMNPTDKPVKIYRRTTLAQFNIVDPDIETFELNGKTEDHAIHCNVQEQTHRDYSSIPDVSNCAFGDRDKERLRNLLHDRHDIFATELKDLRHTSLAQYNITTEGLPIKQRPYQTSPEKRKEIDQKVKEMCDTGIKELSPWKSPVVLVKKNDGTMIFCVDYRKLNAVTKKDSFSLPLITEVLYNLHGTKYSTTLDLKSEYSQINFDPQRKKRRLLQRTHRLN